MLNPQLVDFGLVGVFGSIIRKCSVEGMGQAIVPRQNKIMPFPSEFLMKSFLVVFTITRGSKKVVCGYGEGLIP